MKLDVGQGGRAARLMLSWVVAGLCLAAAGACTFDTPMPRERNLREPATAPRHLSVAIVGLPIEAQLNCSENDCNHWYRVDIVEPGRVSIDVTRRSGGDDSPMRILIRELGRPIIARYSAAAGEPAGLTVELVPGVYAVLVQTGRGTVPYTLLVGLEGEDADAPPARDLIP